MKVCHPVRGGTTQTVRGLGCRPGRQLLTRWETVCRSPRMQDPGSGLCLFYVTALDSGHLGSFIRLGVFIHRTRPDGAAAVPGGWDSAADRRRPLYLCASGELAFLWRRTDSRT